MDSLMTLVVFLSPPPGVIFLPVLASVPHRMHRSSVRHNIGLRPCISVLHDDYIVFVQVVFHKRIQSIASGSGGLRKTG